MEAVRRLLRPDQCQRILEAYLFNILAAVILGFLANIAPALAFMGTLYSLVGLVPGLALTVRRLRDGGNGWGWIFITLVPLVGWIILIVKLCKASVPWVDWVQD